MDQIDRVWLTADRTVIDAEPGAEIDGIVARGINGQFKPRRPTGRQRVRCRDQKRLGRGQRETVAKGSVERHITGSNSCGNRRGPEAGGERVGSVPAQEIRVCFVIAVMCGQHLAMRVCVVVMAGKAVINIFARGQDNRRIDLEFN